jgi:hypothetical protein
MSYVSSMLRQSGAQVGVVRRFGAQRTPPLEVEDLRAVAPSHEPSAVPGRYAPEHSTAAPQRPVVATVPAAAMPAALAPEAVRPLPKAPSAPPEAAPPSAAAGASAARRDVTLPPAARDTAPDGQPTPATTFVRGDAAEAAPPRRKPSATPATDATEPELPREQQVFEHVAEVIAWVAAGADTDEPALAALADRVAPLGEREAARSSKAPIAEDVFEGELPGPESGDVTVTVGAIELTVEAPEPVTDSPVPAVPAVPPTPLEREPAPSSPGLTRHYLRT